jgi:hypothetical protein
VEEENRILPFTLKELDEALPSQITAYDIRVTNMDSNGKPERANIEIMDDTGKRSVVGFDAPFDLEVVRTALLEPYTCEHEVSIANPLACVECFTSGKAFQK